MPPQISNAVPYQPSSDENLLQQSYLTLGGWDDRDLIGEIAWFDTSDSPGAWNSTLTDFKLGDITNMHSTETSVMFQTGYPYIGLPITAYTLIVETLSTY